MLTNDEPAEIDDGANGERFKVGSLNVAKPADRQLIRQAIRHGWDVKPEVQRRLIEKAEELLNKEDLSPRDLSSLGSMLVSVGRLSLDTEKVRLGIPDESEHTLKIEVKRDGPKDPGAKLLRERYK